MTKNHPILEIQKLTKISKSLASLCWKKWTKPWHYKRPVEETSFYDGY